MKDKKPTPVAFDVDRANEALEKATGVKGVYDLYQDREEMGGVMVSRYIYDKDPYQD